MPADVRVEGRVGLIEFDGSRGLDAGLAEALAHACRRLSDEPGVLAVVIAGTGEIFCGDAVPGEGGDEVAAVAALPVPSIAAVNGAAVGVGAELALACDLRVASEAASFQFSHLDHGLLPAAGGTQRLPRIVGRAAALEFLLLGKPVTAQDAWQRGLVSRVVAPGEAGEEALRMAAAVAEKAPVAVRYLREAILKGMDLTLDQGLRLEADLYFLLQTTADRMEGINAFLEKRRPVFRGE